MDRSLLLVHSPLVGPSSWTAVADLARADGRTVALPDLTGVTTVDAPRWRFLVETAAGAAEHLSGPVDVVGHSGAGAYLPAIAERLGDRRGVLSFVDAVVPPASGAHRSAPEQLAHLDALVDDDGLLPGWFDWWPEETVAELVPDPAVRADLVADTPRVPRELYDEDVPVPPGWTRWDAAFLQLGDPYDEDAARAREHGWPTRRLDADHLAIRTDAGRVWAHVDDLTRV
jgi:hypothetical protein